LTDPAGDAAEFERFLEGSTPEVAAMARALRLTVLSELPGAIEWFDPGNRLLAIGTRRSMRDLLFAIIPHTSHVNLQLVDGVDLPNPTGRIEGTGKRARHVKARTLDDVRSPWMRAAIVAQVAHRAASAR
jgi:hypothetical protein